jgi:hypothetical protein
MCDYSLMGLPNRLANEGENLVVRRYSTGSLGLGPEVKSRRGIWEGVKSFFLVAPLPVVCVPPGAKLLLRDIPEPVQERFGLQKDEDVVLTQTGALVDGYRDTIRFRNNTEMLIQQLRPGQRVRVLDLSLAETRDTIDQDITIPLR